MQGHHARLRSIPSFRPALPASRPAAARHARRDGFAVRLRRRIRAYTSVEFLSTHIPGTTGPGQERLLLVNGSQVVGQVRYQLCPPCAHGVITAITLSEPFRDTGLGTRALSHLRARHPGTAWQSTTSTDVEDDLLLRMRIPALASPPSCPHLLA
ncbi:hypothetical protein [Streptomyces griseus]|uniref:hypothetical protein n=1 Tax=Streptomyces griseus TaxID=1911 RepID=UPI0018FE7E45|nr:hypothetical protein [Streptomyces griseus]